MHSLQHFLFKPKACILIASIYQLILTCPVMITYESRKEAHLENLHTLNNYPFNVKALITRLALHNVRNEIYRYRTRKPLPRIILKLSLFIQSKHY